MREEQLIEDRQLRDKMSGRYEVLEKVKELLLIPDKDCMTVQQVAKYYEVDTEVIQKVYQRNKEELESDGSYIEKMEKFLNGNDVYFQKKRNKAVVTYNNGITLTVTNRGLKVFPRRAILRIGMLLRDSGIAKEVRTQLLNIGEKATPEVKTEDLNEEMKLALSLGMAQASGNAEAYQKAVTDMMAFKNRHIQELQVGNEKLINDNKALANGNLEWSDRSQINFAIRKLAGVSGMRVQDLWNNLYQQLLYKHHINVKARGKQPWIQYVKESEWICVNKVFSSMCIAYGTTPSEILTQLNFTA